METFEFEVAVKVKVEAYSKGDAEELLEDTFGPGNDCGVEVIEYKVK